MIALIPVKSIIEWGGLLGLRKGQSRKIIKKTFAERGEHWHNNFRPHHMGRGAFQRYAYTPRTRTYNARKKKHLGHTRPLVFSGTSERLSKQKRVAATSKGVAVRMPVRAFNFRTKRRDGTKSPNMRQEFTQITTAEHDAMDKAQQRRLEHLFNRVKQITRITT